MRVPTLLRGASGLCVCVWASVVCVSPSEGLESLEDRLTESMLSPELPAGGERASLSGLQESAPRNKLGQDIKKIEGSFYPEGCS